MANSVEDLVNEALEEIGYPRPIGDIYEGSPAAIAALQVYGRTRDELLAEGDWPFALRQVALTVVAAQTPPSPWGFEYSYPTDCLRVRYIRPGPLTTGTRSLDPQPQLFMTWNDTRPATPVRAILSDQTGAVLMYIGKVTNPTTWDPGYTKAIIKALAQKLAFRLANTPDMIRARIALSAQATEQGMNVSDASGPEVGFGARQPQQQQR